MINYEQFRKIVRDKTAGRESERSFSLGKTRRKQFRVHNLDFYLVTPKIGWRARIFRLWDGKGQYDYRICDSVSISHGKLWVFSDLFDAEIMKEDNVRFILIEKAKKL